MTAHTRDQAVPSSSEAAPPDQGTATPPRRPGGGLRVLVASGQPALGEALVRWLRGRQVSAVAAPVDGGVSAVAERLRPHVLLLTELDGQDTWSAVLDSCPDARIVVVGDHRPVETPGRVRRAEVVPTTVGLEGLLEVLLHPRTAAAPDGRRVAATADQENADALDRLTRREREVLCELVTGATSLELAERLDISEHTVRSHLQSIFAKLDVHTRLEAAVVAVRCGLRPTVGRGTREDAATW